MLRYPSATSAAAPLAHLKATLSPTSFSWLRHSVPHASDVAMPQAPSRLSPMIVCVRCHASPCVWERVPPTKLDEISATILQQ